MMKKKSGKRFLSWLLAAVMIIALMPANAFANDDNDYGGIDTYANQSYPFPFTPNGSDFSTCTGFIVI